MNREEFLETINSMGLSVSKDQLRRYITKGLLKPGKSSGGRGTYVRSEFAGASINIIQNI